MVVITEAQRKALFGEGVKWTPSGNGSVDFSVNQDQTDKANKGKNSVDTRVFGTKDQILNGDGTMRSGSKSLKKFNDSRQANIEFYKKVIEYTKNGRNGVLPYVEGMDQATYTSVKKWFEANYSDNRIIDAATKAINRINDDSSAIFGTYNRVRQDQGERNGKTARYTTGTVPGTNVKYIALFTMTDFNFSDAIKHGRLRQNGNTDTILGIDKSQRQKTGRVQDELPVTYDDGKVQNPNVAQNFSLNGMDGNKDHQRQQYGLNGEGGYSSVSQFIDKSVNYAAFVLRKEAFQPDFIIAAPSSSDFNRYYCTNLSRKINVPFVDEFYKRNVINVRFDGDKTPEEMMGKGFSPKDIADFESQVRNIAYNEIAWFIAEPVRNYIKEYWNVFGNISMQKSSCEKADFNSVADCMVSYIYQTITNNIDGDGVARHLVHNFLQKQAKLQRSGYDSRHIHQEIVNRIKSKMMRTFTPLMDQVQKLVMQYSDVLKERGYKLTFGTKRFKITSFKKQYRPFLQNVYVIADKELSNGNLQKRYENAKFLIFDEDINSGATLKLAIETLQEKLPGGTGQNLLCLVNGYSSSGF